jgi:hypothetical protein
MGKSVFFYGSLITAVARQGLGAVDVDIVRSTIQLRYFFAPPPVQAQMAESHTYLADPTGFVAEIKASGGFAQSGQDADSIKGLLRAASNLQKLPENTHPNIVAVKENAAAYLEYLKGFPSWEGLMGLAEGRDHPELTAMTIIDEDHEAKIISPLVSKRTHVSIEHDGYTVFFTTPDVELQRTATMVPCVKFAVKPLPDPIVLAASKYPEPFMHWCGLCPFFV